VAAGRVAVLADVHGNAVALEAVIAELEREHPDAIVHCGDLTWGPLPAATVDLLAPLDVLYVSGNAERFVTELPAKLADSTVELTARERWMADNHDQRLRALVASFPATVELEVEGLGAVLFTHGSPRSDEELITVETPEARLADATAGVTAAVVVTAHTHVSYVRNALGRTFLNPGSVGMPYEGAPGAYWALLGPGIEHRRTDYDLDETERRYGESGDPLADEMVEILRQPPTPAEVIAHAESLAFSG
jgi:putative phosphoesterase